MPTDDRQAKVFTTSPDESPMFWVWSASAWRKLVRVESELPPRLDTRLEKLLCRALRAVVDALPEVELEELVLASALISSVRPFCRLE